MQAAVEREMKLSSKVPQTDGGHLLSRSRINTNPVFDQFFMS